SRFNRRTRQRPRTGSFQIAVWTVRPFHSLSRGSPTFTDRSRAMPPRALRRVHRRRRGGGAGRALLEPRANPRRWPQRDERFRPDGLIAPDLDAIPLRDRRDDQERLDHRELIADAAARTGAERDVGEPRPRGFALGRESIRVEALGIRP